ncbi:LLM class flavin-dependent oxidoreductase [Nakamurella silvestris]|nr:LLM class flavin-dependent oxidoreductase [Nakamurella silvestris]
MTARRVPLSVLDLVPVTSGTSPGDALGDTLNLVRNVEAAGYHRYWFAEHHFNDGVIGSAPALLIALAGAVSSRIRLGSGAVQLGHRTALSVAEEFGLLSIAFPGRIDLGLGRSGGASPAAPAPERTSYTTPEGLLIPPAFTRWDRLLGSPRFTAYRDLLVWPGAENVDYDEQVGTVIDLLTGKHTTDGGVDLAVPAAPVGQEPQVWILGSGAGVSATTAGRRGLPFAANYHVAPSSVLEAVRAYRESFVPSPRSEKPWVQVSVDVVVADSDSAARTLAAGYAPWVHSIRSGQGAINYPTPAEAAEFRTTAEDRELVADRVDTQFVGSPKTVVEKLEVLQRATGAEELLITTITHDHTDRVRSYDLLAQAWGP